MNCNLQDCSNCSIANAVMGEPLPNELHLTVLQADVESFKLACSALGVKPVLLDLQLKGGGVMKDLMTSSTHFGTQDQVLAELKRISNGLIDAGFKVIREKVESVPWNTLAPSVENGKQMPKDCYFESHVAIRMGEEHRDFVKQAAKNYGAHLSKNVFKRDVDGFGIVMLTLRTYTDPFEPFKSRVENLANYLSCNGLKTEKLIHEFVWHDTKIDHDQLWIGA